jgi:ATP synthase, F1 delta subunit
MAHDEVIARRYARGLAELAHDEGALSRVRVDLARIAGQLEQHAHDGSVPELYAFLDSPVVTPEEKAAVCGRIMKQIGIGDEVAGLLDLLVRRGRIALMPKIVREYADMAGKLEGELTALVRTARPLSDDQKTRLADALSAAFGRTVRLHQEVQPGLLAGAKITVGDTTFDGTVQGRLDELRHRLTTCGREAPHAAEPAGTGKE